MKLLFCFAFLQFTPPHAINTVIFPQVQGFQVIFLDQFSSIHSYSHFLPDPDIRFYDFNSMDIEANGLLGDSRSVTVVAVTEVREFSSTSSSYTGWSVQPCNNYNSFTDA